MMMECYVGSMCEHIQTAVSLLIPTRWKLSDTVNVVSYFTLLYFTSDFPWEGGGGYAQTCFLRFDTVEHLA